ncbi:hypothetical protein AAH991_38875 [Microbispora sp. ZYX-F-249]|uniref:Uncharacterized protein n=1 Tax=Microbispora maris TaxID=3144104 RepID=A0ABV0B2U5_9ACTN
MEMTYRSSKLLDTDDAMNLVAFIEEASDQGMVLKNVLEAILREDDHVPAEVMRMGIVCAVIVATKVDSHVVVEELQSRKLTPTVTPEMEVMARELLQFAMIPWHPVHGTNYLYAQWNIAGDIEEACQELRRYLEALGGPDFHRICPSNSESSNSDYSSVFLPGRELVESERFRIRQLASNLRAIEIESFNESKDDFWYSDFIFERQTCEFVGGAIVDGCRLLIDDIFDDLKLLDAIGGSVASARPEDFKFLDGLPWRFSASYDSRFVRKFVVVATEMARSLTRDDCISCTSIAVDFVLRSLSWKVESLIQAYAGLDEVGSQAIAQRVSRELCQSEERRDLWELSRSSSHYQISRLIPFVSDGFDGPPRLIRPDQWFLTFDSSENSSPYLLH